MLAPALICDSSIMNKRLLDTTIVNRYLTLDTWVDRIPRWVGLCCIPGRLGGVKDLLIQILRPAACFVKYKENNKGEDTSLL